MLLISLRHFRIFDSMQISQQRLDSFSTVLMIVTEAFVYINGISEIVLRAIAHGVSRTLAT